MKKEELINQFDEVLKGIDRCPDMATTGVAILKVLTQQYIERCEQHALMLQEAHEHEIKLLKEGREWIEAKE